MSKNFRILNFRILNFCILNFCILNFCILNFRILNFHIDHFRTPIQLRKVKINKLINCEKLHMSIASIYVRFLRYKFI